MIPILEVFKEYFDLKYPCNDESKYGIEMPIEDEIKYVIYNNLLATYNDFEEVFKDSYNHCIQILTDNER